MTCTEASQREERNINASRERGIFHKILEYRRRLARRFERESAGTRLRFEPKCLIVIAVYQRGEQPQQADGQLHCTGHDTPPLENGRMELPARLKTMT